MEQLTERVSTLEDLMEMLVQESLKTQMGFQRLQEGNHARSAETDRQIKETSKKIGELGNRLGEFVEKMISSCAAKLFQEWGVDASMTAKEVSFDNGEGGIEIDLLVRKRGVST